MSVTVRTDDAAWSGTCSYLADCVATLVDAALRLGEGRPAADVVFFHEPTASVLRCDDAGDEVRLVIVSAPTCPPPPPRRLDEVVFEAVVARDAFVRAVWTGVRRLEGLIGRDAYEAGWQAPFPARAMEQLGAQIKSR